MNKYAENFIQSNSPDGGFLQSEEWRKFQESIGKKTFHVNFWPAHNASRSEAGGANVIEHTLPAVGKYWYIPRGPIIEILNPKSQVPNNIQNSKFKIQNLFSELMKLAKENNIGWIRIEPAIDKILDLIKRSVDYKIKKAPHDMQPREILVLDITKSEEELLAQMKQKTRYNIRLAEKKNVRVIIHQSSDVNKEYIEEFTKLVKVTAQRDKITSHPENYYRKMFEVIPEDTLRLYIAEYNNKIVAANLMIFYGKTATYLHGASDNEFRNVMAPYLLQWQAIKDAKKAGCEYYDFGGVKISNSPNYLISNQIPNSKPQIPNKSQNSKFKIQNSASDSWQGITKFKTGFAPNVRPIVFPGSYDIVLNPAKYYLYKLMQKAKSLLK